MSRKKLKLEDQLIQEERALSQEQSIEISKKTLGKTHSGIVINCPSLATQSVIERFHAILTPDISNTDILAVMFYISSCNFNDLFSTIPSQIAQKTIIIDAYKFIENHDVGLDEALVYAELFSQELQKKMQSSALLREKITKR